MLGGMLSALWTDLTAWLEANAPVTFGALRPAGDPGRLAQAEEQLGFPLGAELTQWWRLHDGSDGTEILPAITMPGLPLFGVDRMRDTHRMELEINSEAGAAEFPPRFIPIGDDGGGNYLVVDRRSGPEDGSLRDHDHEARGVIQPVMFASLADFLTQSVSALRTGQPMALGPRVTRSPSVTDGRLSWQ